MTELAHIRELEVRLHAYCLDFPDTHLMNELLFLLDELQSIHDDLDRCEIAMNDANHTPLTLSQRVALLIRQTKAKHVIQEQTIAQLDFYDKPMEGEWKQSRLL